MKTCTGSRSRPRSCVTCGRKSSVNAPSAGSANGPSRSRRRSCTIRNIPALPLRHSVMRVSAAIRTHFNTAHRKGRPSRNPSPSVRCRFARWAAPDKPINQGRALRATIPDRDRSPGSAAWGATAISGAAVLTLLAAYHPAGFCRRSCAVDADFAVPMYHPRWSCLKKLL